MNLQKWVKLLCWPQMVLFRSCGRDVWGALVFELQQALLMGAKGTVFF